MYIGVENCSNIKNHSSIIQLLFAINFGCGRIANDKYFIRVKVMAKKKSSNSVHFEKSSDVTNVKKKPRI